MSVALPIEENPRFRRYTASAGQTVFSIPFPFQQAEDVSIQLFSNGIYTELDRTTFTITGEMNPLGGSVTFNAGRSAGDIIVVVGAAILERLSSIVRDGRFSSKLTDDELDRNRIIQQEQQRDINRSLKAPYGSEGVTLTASTPSALLHLDAHGNIVSSETPIDEKSQRENGDKALASLINQQGEIAEHFFESDTAVEFAITKPTFKIISTGGGEAPGDGDGGFYVDEDNGSQRIIVDAGGRTWYRVPDLMPDREWRSVNQQRLALVNNKLLAGGNLSIVCVGDSMTYGYDNFSANRLPPVNGDVATRAPIQYPSRLQDRLNALTKSSVTVINRGFSGDTARMCFQRWTSRPTADLAVIMLGINDANGVAGATFSEFCLYMERLIQRYLLWGCGLVLLTAPGVDMANAAHPSARYSMYVRSLAKQYGCPLFESIEAVQYCIASEIHSDSVHYNHIGYAKFGDAVASFIMSGALAGIERKISSEVISSFSRYSEGIGIHAKNCNFFNNYNDSYATSGAVCGIQPGGRISISFYLDAEAADICLLGGINTNARVVLSSLVDGKGRNFASVKNRVGRRIRETSEYVGTYWTSARDQERQIGSLVGRGWKTLILINDDSAIMWINEFIIRPILQSLSEVDNFEAVSANRETFVRYIPAQIVGQKTLPAPVSLPQYLLVPMPSAGIHALSNEVHHHWFRTIDVTVKAVGTSSGTDGILKVTLMKGLDANWTVIQTFKSSTSGLSIVSARSGFAAFKTTDVTIADITYGVTPVGDGSSRWLIIEFNAPGNGYYTVEVEASETRSSQATYIN